MPMWKARVPGESITPAVADKPTKRPTKRPNVTPGMIPGEGLFDKIICITHSIKIINKF